MWKRVGIFVIADIVLGAVLSAGVGFFFAKTSTGQAMLRDFLIAQTNKNTGDETPPLALSSATSTTNVSATSTPILPIPESYATVEYFTAINNVLQDLVLMNTINAQLGPVLDSLNKLTLSGSYNGFFDLMARARDLSNKNQSLAAQFTLHINALNTANVKTMDAVTKSQTQTVVASGQSLGAALKEYATAVQTILYGDTPTSAQLAEFEGKVNAAGASSQSFADALKPLLDHIGTEVKRLQAAGQASQ